MQYFTPQKIKDLPDLPGVYLMRGINERLLYVGKATSLKKRAGSYFNRPHEARIQQMVGLIKTIEVRETKSALEALLLEAELIKKYQPPYNIMAKDDKTFAIIGITNEYIPRVIVTRPTSSDAKNLKWTFGPYLSAQTARTALKIIRRIFPFHSSNTNSTNYRPNTANTTNSYDRHSGKSQSNRDASRIESDPGPGQDDRRRRVCFDTTIGLCSGVCGGKQTVADYKKMLGRLRMFLTGQRARVISSLRRAMTKAARSERYEEAAKIRNQLFTLEHIRDIALLKQDEFGIANEHHTDYYIPPRAEAYDISHVFGEDAVGSMVVFTNGKIDTNEYRKFKIRWVKGTNDTAMIQEVLVRRFQHPEWQFPDLILIDGGSGQLHAARQITNRLKLTIPTAALAKGPTRKKADLYCSDPMVKLIPLSLLIKLREEAHRFAIKYHRELKRKGLTVVNSEQ